jgi:hypothetical protein
MFVITLRLKFKKTEITLPPKLEKLFLGVSGDVLRGQSSL